jgi:hypothetical protein
MKAKSATIYPILALTCALVAGFQGSASPIVMGDRVCRQKFWQAHQRAATASAMTTKALTTVLGVQPVSTASITSIHHGLILADANRFGCRDGDAVV